PRRSLPSSSLFPYTTLFRSALRLRCLVPFQITSSFRIAGGVVTTCNHLTPSPRGKVKRPRSEASLGQLPRWQGRVICGSALLRGLQLRHVLPHVDDSGPDLDARGTCRYR